MDWMHIAILLIFVFLLKNLKTIKSYAKTLTYFLYLVNFCFMSLEVINILLKIFISKLYINQGSCSLAFYSGMDLISKTCQNVFLLWQTSRVSLHCIRYICDFYNSVRIEAILHLVRPNKNDHNVMTVKYLRRLLRDHLT